MQLIGMSNRTLMFASFNNDLGVTGATRVSEPRTWIVGAMSWICRVESRARLKTPLAGRERVVLPLISQPLRQHLMLQVEGLLRLMRLLVSVQQMPSYRKQQQ